MGEARLLYPSASPHHDTEEPTPATRVREAAGYHWNNTGHPLICSIRRLIDAHGAPGPAVRSAAVGGPSLLYTGLTIGQLNVRQLLERRRTTLGGGTPRLHHESTSWRELQNGHFPEADLVFVGAEDDRIRRLPSTRAFVAPFRVHLVVNTANGPDAVRARVSRRERWEFGRNSKRRRWTLQEHNSVDALRFFYDRMHVPTMRARHAEQSRTESFAVARDHIFRHGRLMFLFEDDRPVAGVLCHERHSTLTTRLLGVLDGSAKHYDSGAFKAVYHLLLAWAAARNFTEVDFYGTEAFLAKGIFQWKRKFAPCVVLPPNHFRTKRLYVAVRRDTEQVRDFLVANPFLEIDRQGTMRAIYFHDAVRPARTDISAKADKLAAPHHVDLDEFFTEHQALQTGG